MEKDGLYEMSRNISKTSSQILKILQDIFTQSKLLVLGVLVKLSE